MNTDMNIYQPAILLSSGNYFNFLKPEESKFNIFDVAHALSNICRFNGHCNRFYSVAQHSVLVSRNVPPEFALQGLLHDATEAFIGDVTKPLKALLPDFQELERRIESAVFKRFNLPDKLAQVIKEVDLMALLTEQRDLMDNNDEWPCLHGIQPFKYEIIPLGPSLAYNEFIRRWSEITP